MKKAFDFINKIDSRIVIILVLIIHDAGFYLIDNEEQYFLYAKQFIDHSWLQNSFIANDVAGTRILFQFLAGAFLKFFSFEQLAFFGRIFNFILLAFPLARLIKRFKINNIWFIFLFLAFYLPHQALMGGEWIFGGFEAKTLAYIFILYGLDYILREKYLKAVVMASISMYFHVLAGGWFLLYVFVFMVFSKEKILDIFKKGILSLIIISPLVIYLYKSLIQNNPVVIDGVNTNYIYTAIRNPNHTGILSNMHYFLSHHLDGVIITIIVLIISLVWLNKQKESLLLKSNLLVKIILIQNLVFVVIAYFDKNGALMKYYPFRGSAIAMLLLQLIIIYKLIEALPKFGEYLKNKKWIEQYSNIQSFTNDSIFILAILALFFTSISRYKDYQNKKPHYNAVSQAAKILKDNSKKGDIFMLYGNENQYTYSIMRNSGRDMFFCYRFIPTRSYDIYEWYRRFLLQSEVVNDIERLPSLLSEYNIKYIIASNPLNSPYLSLIWKSSEYAIYRVCPSNEAFVNVFCPNREHIVFKCLR
jgi:hypothetical protein